MRFLPVFLDLQTGPVLLVAPASWRGRSCACCWRQARASAGTRPSGMHDVRGIDAADTARIELAKAIRSLPNSGRDCDPVRRRRRNRSCDVGAGQGGRPARQCDGRSRAFDVYFSRHRRSRRCRRRGRHRRRFAGGGAPRARTHRSGAAGADRRSRRVHRPLAQIRSMAAFPNLRCAAASGSAWSMARSARWCLPDAKTRPRRHWRISPIPPPLPARRVGQGRGQGDAGRRRSGRSGFAHHQGAARVAGR